MTYQENKLADLQIAIDNVTAMQIDIEELQLAISKLVNYSANIDAFFGQLARLEERIDAINDRIDDLENRIDQ